MPEPKEVFLHARIKVEGANRHIDYVGQWIAAISEAGYGRVFVDLDANTGYNILCYETSGVIAGGLPLSIGDAIHNLRSALDYVTSHIVGADNHRAHFPFESTRERLEKSSSYKLVEGASPEAARFILNNVRPYETGGGDYDLWAIHRLDNTDKHKLLIPVVTVSGFAGIDAKDENNNVLRPTIRFTGAGKQGLIWTDSKITINNQGKAILEVFFGEDQCFGGKPVVPTLLNLSDRVLQTIKAIELTYFGERAEG